MLEVFAESATLVETRRGGNKVYHPVENLYIPDISAPNRWKSIAAGVVSVALGAVVGYQAAKPGLQREAENQQADVIAAACRAEPARPVTLQGSQGPVTFTPVCK
ncbi:MAG: hypothetical protein WDO70_07080 [Alphaproteobacteria bacterium]